MRVSFPAPAMNHQVKFGSMADLNVYQASSSNFRKAKALVKTGILKKTIAALNLSSPLTYKSLLSAIVEKSEKQGQGTSTANLLSIKASQSAINSLFLTTYIENLSLASEKTQATEMRQAILDFNTQGLVRLQDEGRGSEVVFITDFGKLVDSMPETEGYHY